MPRSKPIRTVKKASRSHKQYKRGSRQGPPVMVAPEVIDVPDDENHPGGGLLIRYKDTEGILHKEAFYPNDVAAFSLKTLDAVMQDLYGVAGPVDYESVLEDAKDVPVAFKAPNSSDRHLYRTFEFSPTLWIRVWDSSIPLLPGGHVEFFGVDMIDVSGRPQAVHTRIKVIAGVRPPMAPEQEGDIVQAIDDIGVRMDRFDLVPSRYPIAANCEYIFEDGRHKVTYPFHHNLLKEPAPERLTRWTRTKTGVGRSRSVD